VVWILAAGGWALIAKIGEIKERWLCNGGGA
jgi:hypothetical protein